VRGVWVLWVGVFVLGGGGGARRRAPPPPVESRTNLGSIFWFEIRLPGGGHIEAEALAEKVNFAVLRDASILLVEDNPFNQQVAIEILAEKGANTIVANNGQEALDLLRTQKFDCILMDVQMPVMDGLEATRQIRANPDLEDNYIIAMTANARGEDKAHCFEAGMNDFLSKPVFAEHLYTAIAKGMGLSAAAKVHYPLNSSREASSSLYRKNAYSPQPGSADNSALIDLLALKKMMGFDPVKVHKFALKFLHTTQQGLHEIEDMLKQGNMTGLAALGHRNKTPARTVGARGFADMCQSLEQFKDGGDIEKARLIVAGMQPLLDQIAEQINKEAS